MNRYELLIEASQKVKDAQQREWEALKTNFPPGSEVIFDHHGHRQTGTVEELIGRAGLPDLLVTNNKTGTTRRISLWHIIEAYRNS